jgi:hypothetical protein
MNFILFLESIRTLSTFQPFFFTTITHKSSTAHDKLNQELFYSSGYVKFTSSHFPSNLFPKLNPRFTKCHIVTLLFDTSLESYTELLANNNSLSINNQSSYYKPYPCGPDDNIRYVFFTKREVKDFKNIVPKTPRVIGNTVFVTNGDNHQTFQEFYWVGNYFIQQSLQPSERQDWKSVKHALQYRIKQRPNLHLEEFFYIQAYPMNLTIFKDLMFYSILRKEPYSNSAVLLGYHIISRLNATVKLLWEPSHMKSLDHLMTTKQNAITLIMDASERSWRKFQFTSLFTHSCMGFISRKPVQTGHSFHFLLKPFELYVWVGLLFTGLIASVSLAIMMIVRVDTDKKFIQLKNILTELPCIGLTLALPVLDMCPEMPKKMTLNMSFQTRLILGTWLLCAILIGSLYRSNFVAFFIQPSYVSPPRNFRELANSNYKMNIAEGYPTKELTEMLLMYSVSHTKQFKFDFIPNKIKQSVSSK